MISVVIPSYNEEDVIKLTATTIEKILNKNKIPYELVFVDDGSIDNTWSEIISISKNSKNIRGVKFSKNFGKDSAIMAGLTEATGDCCVVIDCDLQHPPEKIIEMYNLWKKGYEIVEGQKNSRGKENFIRSASAKIFNSIITSIIGIDMNNASDFKLLDRKVINVLVNMREKKAFFRALSAWVGFNTTVVKFDVQERKTGKTKWSTFQLIKYAFNNISSFSTAPMQIVTFFGIVMLLFSLILGMISLFQKINGQALEGFTTVILILLFSSSIIMISLGMIGYYIAKIYDEIKDRPRYIVSKKCGKENVKKNK